MIEQWILELRFVRADAWDDAAAGLGARLAEPHGAEVDAQLIRRDARRGLLLVSTCDAAALARARASWLDPWLATCELAKPATIERGDVLVAHRGAHGARGPDHDAVPDDERVARFVAEVVAGGTVWGLYADTWARSPVAGDVEALPFWSSRAAAARCVDGPWAAHAPRAVALDDLRRQWLTGMEEDGIVAVVAPTPTHPGTIVDPAALARALRAS